MITLTASDVRSISMRGMPAEPNSFETWSRILRSWSSKRPKSFLLAYQRERHGSMVPRRKPVGWIFCPMVSRRAAYFFRSDLGPFGVLGDLVFAGFFSAGSVTAASAFAALDLVVLRFGAARAPVFADFVWVSEASGSTD